MARPVLEGSFERSLQLAASMDARGYGRRAAVPRPTRVLTAACTLGGMLGVLCGVYGLLDAGTPGWIGLPLLAAGLLVALAGMALAGHASTRSRYRPDPWVGPEWVTAISGAVPAVVLVVCSAQGMAALVGPSIPLQWPTLPLVPLVAILVALLPSVATPLQEEPTAPAAEVSAHDHRAEAVAA